jgi:Flp pilus assembly protein TadD
LLLEAERFFFSTLFVNPVDPSALNGLGNVLTFERDYEAAEFFVERALEIEPSYEQALHDLALIRSLNVRPRTRR